jgi:hypothetical protein
MQNVASAYIGVPYPPPPARVEIVPTRPREGAVWADGDWSWDGARYRWRAGGWVVAPAGVGLARWVTARGSDGRLWFAPASWRHADGTPAETPEILAAASDHAE